MDHIAILQKDKKFLDKILSGEKTIESRWYVNKNAPWNKITREDTIYLKESGNPIHTKAKVRRVIQEELTPTRIKHILKKYHRRIGIKLEETQSFFAENSHKRYCILIFLKDPEKIEPFQIDKRGFGIRSAWLTLPDINSIKIS